MLSMLVYAVSYMCISISVSKVQSICGLPMCPRHLNGYPDRPPVRPNISLGDTLAGAGGGVCVLGGQLSDHHDMWHMVASLIAPAAHQI
jgi:hypothetical protein